MLAAFAAFSLCASSVYVLNDMLDLEADRAHPRKSKRPFASGELSLTTGFVLVPVLLAGAATFAAFLPEKFQLSLAAYYVLTVAYSTVLKRFLLVDEVALAGLYTLRIIAGAEAVSVALSFWLLLFSVFLFLSLAFVKRYAELDSAATAAMLAGPRPRLPRRGSGGAAEPGDLLAGYLSVLVLALYINSPDIQPLYHRPKAIWMLCVLMLYWISRMWMTAHRGKMHDDPVVYALKDRLSLGARADRRHHDSYRDLDRPDGLARHVVVGKRDPRAARGVWIARPPRFLSNVTRSRHRVAFRQWTQLRRQLL